jgi:hypothetical protein
MLRPGDFVTAAASGGLQRSLKIWSAWNESLRFFVVPYDTVGTVVEIHPTDKNVWCRVIFPQGVGWATSDNLDILE